MKKPLKIGVGVLVVLLLLLGGGYGWAVMRAIGLRSTEVPTHRIDFPIPFPLTQAELAEVPQGADPGAVAHEHAIERGRHLVSSRYACVECHGQNFGGGVMVDDPMIGRLLGPNITAGRGSRTVAFTASDWDRAVRHGVLSDGLPSAMPAEDFQLMSDQELSDIVSYIRSLPPVDNEVPEIKLGPLGTVLVATGALPFAALSVVEHDKTHPVLPPVSEVSVEFGRHLSGVCMGCHRADLSGGPIPGGDPSWVPARNLTPHAEGLAGWSYDDFVTAAREGKRPDGTDLQAPMTLILPYARNMTEVEMQALWAFLQSVEPKPTGT
jgi:mono/diheme cytochrome c family protein